MYKIYKKLRKKVKRFIRRGFLFLIHGVRYVSIGEILSLRHSKKNSKTIYWLGSFPPWQRNVGDHAQTYAIKLFLKKYFYDYNIKRIDKHKLKIKKVENINRKIKNNDLVFVSSNGDFGDLYAENTIAMSHARRMIAEHIIKAKKIYLSSTVYYKRKSNDYWANKDSSIFSGDNNIILCRESFSLEMLKSVGLDGFIFPDIVFYLKANRNYPKKINTNKALLTLRDINKESSLSKEDHKNIINILNSSKFTTSYDDIHYAKSPIYDFMYDKYFNKLNKKYQSFDLIVTDRMHCMIFAALNGIACIAIKNEIPHKICAYKEWLGDETGTVFIDSAEELPSAIKKVSKLKVNPIDLNYKFEEFRGLYVNSS